MEAPMGPIPKEYRRKIIKDGDRRLIAVPDDFFLEGEEIIIRQERDGAISVHPAEEAAREAMWERFNPFSEWENETRPGNVKPDI
jgi:hypothetical protein